MPQRDDPNAVRLLVVFLRFYADMTQTEFGKACRVDQSDISKYESGKLVPPEDALRRMASVAGIGWPLVTHLRRSFAAILAASARGSAVAEVSPLDPAVLEQALLAATPYLVEASLDEAYPKTPEEARREAEEIWAALERFPPTVRRRWIVLSLRASRSWALVERLCHASEEAASHKAEESLELAALALFIAERVPGEEGWRSRIQGYCWAYVGNSRRVANNFVGADEAFARAWVLWRADAASDPGLLAEWRLLDREASLRRAQQRYSEALSLLDRALISSRGDLWAAARILLNKEHVCEQMGDIQAALLALEEAAPFVAASRDPRLLFAHRFNLAADLCHLDRFDEAAGLLPEVREWAVSQAGELSLIRVDWLTARVAAGQGRREEAIAGLEQVGRYFTDKKLPYDAALAALELAVLWLEANRTAEVRELAVDLEWVFQAQGIHREALAAVNLFCEAARREAATVDLARRIGEYLCRSRHDPELRFDPGQESG